MVARIEVPGATREEIVALRHVRSAMIRRCYNPRCDKYQYYGGAGIRVCDDWLRSVEAFIAWAIGNGFQIGLELDRRETTDDYSPTTCRWATVAQQRWNRSKLAASRAASKYKGVGRCVSSQRNPWRAQIRCHGKRMNLGLFPTEESAARAYDAAALEHFGDFARLNFPQEAGAVVGS